MEYQADSSKNNCSVASNPGLDHGCKDISLGDKELSPNRDSSLAVSNASETDQEHGWSKVGPRKQKKIKKK